MVLFGAVIVACSAVLGFEPLTRLPNDADVSDSGDADGGDSSRTVQDGGGDVDAATAETSCGADLTNDPANCGRCNHDCAFGTCEAGACKPLKLADGLAVPQGLVVDGTDVFVAEYDLNRIARFGKNALGPCATPPVPAQCVFTEDQANVFKPTGMGIDATNIYWANTGSGLNHEIRSCPRAGCGAQTATLIAQLGQDALAHLFGSGVLPLDLVVRDGQVFWPESGGGAIRSAAVDGGGLVTTYLENGSFMPLAIAVDNTEIFFTDDTNQHPTRIQAVPRHGSARDGGAVTFVASTPGRPYGIGLSASGNLYWTVPFIAASGDGVVQATSKSADGGAPIGAVATMEIDPRALLVDASNLYWLVTGSEDAATGMVVYCPLAKGCPPEGPIILAKGQKHPLHLTQDDSAIYWSNEGLATSLTYDGQVWKVAKP
jgi:sugar lactone lactonase YvrE